MAWISSESFYQRLIRSQLQNAAQLQEQDSTAVKCMQDEMEALINERDELYSWKEAHLNVRPDSSMRDCAQLQGRNQSLEVALAECQGECKRLRDDKVSLTSIVRGLEDDMSEKTRLRESFEKLRAAHEKLKKSNLELENHFAAASQDLEVHIMANKRLECIRKSLCLEVDQGRTELRTLRLMSCRLVRDHACGETKVASLKARLEEAYGNIRELHKVKAELEPRISGLTEELRMSTALADQREHLENEFEVLRSKYGLLLKAHASAVDRLAANKHLDSFDNFSDGMLRATLVLLLMLGLYGVMTDKLA